MKYEDRRVVFEVVRQRGEKSFEVPGIDLYFEAVQERPMKYCD